MWGSRSASPNGGNDGNIVETTPDGDQVAQFPLDTSNGTGAGALFGLTVTPGDDGVLFVDDADNTLRLFN